MEKININLPAACYNVEKILGISHGQGNQKNYKVQWTPSWVSEIYLVGCTELIKQFLSEGDDDVNIDTCQDKVFDEIKEEEESSIHQNEVESASHNVDIFSTELKENNIDHQQDTTPTEVREDSNKDTEVREDVTNNQPANVNKGDIPSEVTSEVNIQLNKEILLDGIKMEEQEAVSTHINEEVVAVCGDEIKVEESEGCSLPVVENISIQTNHNIPQTIAVEGGIVNASETCVQLPHTNTNTSNTLNTNHDNFHLNGDNYHFGQYLKEKDATSTPPTVSTDWKKVRKQPFNYEDVSAYPSYPETHTIDKPKVAKQMFNRKRAISHDMNEISTYAKYPNNGLQKIDKTNFSQQQPSNPRCSKTYKQGPGGDSQMTAKENTQSNASTAISMDIQANAAIALSMDTQTNLATAVSMNTFPQHHSKGIGASNVLTQACKQNIVDLTDEGDTCTFTKHASTFSNSYRITDKYKINEQNKNNFIDPGGHTDMTTYASSTCNSFVNTTTSREEPISSNEVNSSKSSHVDHGGVGSQNTFESQEMNNFSNADDDGDAFDSPNVMHRKAFGSPPIQGCNRVVHDGISRSLRRMVKQQMRDTLKEFGNVSVKTSEEHELLIFEKAQSRDNYLQMVSRLVLYIKERKKRREGGGGGGDVIVI